MEQAEILEAVGTAIRLAAGELGPWIESRIEGWPPDRDGRVAPTDPAYLVGVLLDRWRTDFSVALGPEGMTVVQDLRHTRNRWAHNVPFDDLDAFRGIDTCRRLMLAIGASSTADRLEGMSRRLFASSTNQSVVLGIRASTPSAGSAPTPQPLEHRKMRSAVFRDEQWLHRFDNHVAPLNALVDDLIDEHPDRWMPYIAPYHGGIEADILLLFQDPGKMTSLEHGGSGFLGCENDDPSAQLAAECLEIAGIAQSRVTPWNAYPWFIPDQTGPKARMLAAGLEPLRRLLELMPQLDTVVTCGAVAHRSWEKFEGSDVLAARHLRHLRTFHTSGRGITNGGQQTKSSGVEHVVNTLRAAGTPGESRSRVRNPHHDPALRVVGPLPRPAERFQGPTVDGFRWRPPSS